jgi:hypothetical protein
MKAALKGKRRSAFSVAPFTRAQMHLPRSELSVPAPDTYTKVMPGLTRAKTLATESVRL